MNSRADKLPDGCRGFNAKFRMPNAELEDVSIHHLSFITHNSPQALRGWGYGE